MPKVSIIIPTYNRAEYLVQAIESALAQDYPNLEIVVSDNYSTDGTQKVVKKYFNDKRFKYFRNEKNLGMVGNWRKALYEYIVGEWAIILSDDDYFIDNKYISVAIKIIQEYKNLVLVHANQVIYFEDINKNYKNKKLLPKILDGKIMFLNFGGMYTFNFATTLFNVDMVRSNKGFQQDILSSDWLEFLKLCLEGNVGFIDDFVSVYRRHLSSEMARANIDALFENVKYILIPYQEAKNKQIFPDELLKKWKKRLLKNYFDGVLDKVLSMNDIKVLFEFFVRVRKNYSSVLIIFLYPKNLIKLLTFKFPFIFYGIKKIKNKLKNKE